jgi:hypothetical protein
MAQWWGIDGEWAFWDLKRVLERFRGMVLAHSAQYF